MNEGFIVAGEGDGRRRVAVGSSLVVGRSAECDVTIDDVAASRQHLEIRASDGGFLCRDLGSKNGTKVNGSPIRACQLKHGDRIRIGQTVLRFESGEGVEPEGGRTVFLQTVLDRAGREQEPLPSSRSKELLEAAYTLMNAIASNFNPCDLVDSVLRTTTEAIRAQRGAIVFAGPDGSLEPCGICECVHSIRDGVPQPGQLDEIHISESVAHRVLQEGENVLFQLARTSSDAEATESIVDLALTSILCVPIRTQNEIQGILYMDTDVRDHEYTEDDLLLAAAAGNSAGLALENARIHQTLLEKNRIEQEIADAWAIQEGLLVSDWPADDRRFDVYGKTRPAKTVGGDFYDFVRLSPDRVGVLIGDVSGKGVPAALTMAQMLAEFRLSAHDTDSPAEVLARLNEQLVARSRRGTFCSMCFVIVDLASGRIVGANAGHHPVMIVSGDGSRTVVEASAPPTGLLPEIEWADEKTAMRPGETLLIYTDGIVEARSGATRTSLDDPFDEYGADRLERVVCEHFDAAPADLIDMVMRDVDLFCSPLSPHDDCTMIALRYLDDGQ
jgi:serine phosphatase RsbU (regulator of sigma subunit)